MQNDNDLPDKLRHWLETQGYPLEMRTAAALREAGFRVVQSDYYQDPHSKQHREIDVKASVQADADGALIRVSYVFECKLTRDRPWILFTGERRLANPAAVAQRTASNLGRRFLMHLAKDATIQQLPLLTVPVRPGYGITQGFTTGKDVAYEACTSVAAAAVAIVGEADRPRAHGERKYIEIAFPVVLIDGRLFEAFINESQTLEVGELTSGNLVWRNPLGNIVHSLIHIVTASHLPQFASEAMTTAASLLSRLDAVKVAVEGKGSE
jgi:hypothetical protein